MAGADDLNQILDGMDQEMFDGYQAYATECVEGWTGFQGNHGQMVILTKHIIPAAEQHAHYARTDWPETAGPEQYSEAIYGCFDPEVIDNAFSDTLNDIIASLQEYWDESTSIQQEHVFTLEALGGGGENDGPHSTHDIWRGGPYGPTM